MLMTRLEKVLTDPKIMLICDSYDCMVCGLDTDSPELNLIEFMNSLPPRHAVIFNRDLQSDVSLRYLSEEKERS